MVSIFYYVIVVFDWNVINVTRTVMSADSQLDIGHDSSLLPFMIRVFVVNLSGY